MALKFPDSMDECVYFTRRSIGKGSAVAWVFRELCPKCKKSLMSKPREKGKVKIRASEYVCEACGHNVEKQAYEDTLTVNIQYTCHKCSNKGEVQIPFKRKKVQLFDEEKQKKKTAEVLRFQCQKCKENVDITKKMK